MGTFIGIVTIVLILWFWLKNWSEENERENHKRYIEDQESRIRKDYPDGYNHYKYYWDRCVAIGGVISNSLLNTRNAEQIVEMKSEIIKFQQKIDANRKKEAAEYNELESNQKDFNAEGISLAKKIAPSFGRYTYSIPWEKRDEKGNLKKTNLEIWQFFPDSVCLNQELDYSLMEWRRDNFNNLPEFKAKTRHWNDSVYDSINTFIKEIAIKYPLGLLFNNYINGWQEDALSYHYAKISKDIQNTKVVELDYMNRKLLQDIKFLIIIDCFTENSVLIEKCKNILTNNKVCIIYLSLLKCHDTKEMQDIINQRKIEYEKEQEQIRIEEEARKKKEQEEKIIAEYNRIKEQYPAGTEFFLEYILRYDGNVPFAVYRHEAMIKKYEPIYSEYLNIERLYPHGLDKFETQNIDERFSNIEVYVENVVKNKKEISELESTYLNQEKEQQNINCKKLKLSVSPWKILHGSIPYNHLLYYYPTTCETEATDDEWDDRWTVWNFKNTPGKTKEFDHEKVLDEVIPQIISKLHEVFDDESLSRLTLVCIPASSAEKTEKRYKEFSQRLCEETGMINAFCHISVTENSEEKKFGGKGMTTNNVTFDEAFFKTSNVLLFDDVITKGETMLRFKNKLEQLGANVICGFSIGKTKHEHI